MSFNNQLSTGRRVTVLVTVLLALTHVSMAAADQPAIQPEAAKLFEKSLSYLAGLDTFGLESNSSIEIVLEDGQKLQFDHAVTAIVQRPNKLFARRLGELADEEVFYDGKNLAMHYPGAGFYASVAAPDTLEAMLDFAMLKLDLVAPAGDFLYSNAYELLMQDVQSGFVVSKPAFVEGVVCDHLAFRTVDTDFQVWLEQGERPLPRKVVITSRDILNAPQYTVRISKWDLQPAISENTFRFDAPEDANRIEFIMLDGDAQ